MNQPKLAVRLTESAVMLALSLVLSLVQVMPMPYGGTVTLCSMLPLILIAYRYGVKWGCLVGFAGSLIQLLLGMDNLAYATSALAAVAIILLDYLFAFTAMGLSGLFRGKCRNQATEVALGTLVACVLRYLCHVISGCTVWAGLSIPDADALVYSLIYNAAYMVPETVVTVAGALAICSMLDFRKEKLSRLSGTHGQMVPVIAAVVAIIAIAADAILLFAAIQTENGFDITNITTANWPVIIVLGVVGVVGAVIAAVVGRRKQANA